MTTLVKIGIAGLGTVGGGVLKIIQTHGDLLEARSGARLTVTAVSGRDKTKNRGVSLDGLTCMTMQRRWPRIRMSISCWN